MQQHSALQAAPDIKMTEHTVAFLELYIYYNTAL